MAKRSSHQQRIIRDYYKNLDAILIQRLGDLVTDLYLAEGKARSRLWKRTGETLAKLKVPPARVAHIVASDNPTLVANELKRLLDESSQAGR